MDPLNLVKLPALMERTIGNANVLVGLIDGPVLMEHRDLATASIREISAKSPGACARAESAACIHGTFVAGILCAKRASVAPAICPDCTFLVRPIFAESTPPNGEMPSARPHELAEAIVDCVTTGARIINLSLAVCQLPSLDDSELEEALNFAARRGAVVVAAAGNQGTIGSSAITRHSWVIPVIACDLLGRPMEESNLGRSIGMRGLRAPGDAVRSLGPKSGEPVTLSGTSAAAPFVSGTLALLWSEFPAATAGEIRAAITRAGVHHRRTIVPPLLDAWAAYQALDERF